MYKSAVFPFGVSLSEGGRVGILPAAEVGLFLKGGEEATFFLIIDSGAAVSALPISDAALLGINPEAGDQVSVNGISGELLRGWLHEITARLGEETVTLPVVFLESQYAPRVLGRAGVFDKFIVIIEETKRRSGFLRGKESQSVSRILDDIEDRYYRIGARPLGNLTPAWFTHAGVLFLLN